MRYDNCMRYVIGLGNPGSRYEGTRHNVGQLALAWLVEQIQAPAFTSDKLVRARTTTIQLGEETATLLLPQTFMNRSGETVGYLKKQGMQPDQLVVVYDDVDLPVGELKVSYSRGDGGHNGLASIISAFGSKDFPRVRIGVARTNFWTGKTVRPGGAALPGHVLSRFTSGEQKKLMLVYPKVERALTLIVNDGVERAMNEVN